MLTITLLILVVKVIRAMKLKESKYLTGSTWCWRPHRVRVSSGTH